LSTPSLEDPTDKNDSTAFFVLRRSQIFTVPSIPPEAMWNGEVGCEATAFTGDVWGRLIGGEVPETNCQPTRAKKLRMSKPDSEKILIVRSPLAVASVFPSIVIARSNMTFSGTI